MSTPSIWPVGKRKSFDNMTFENVGLLEQRADVDCYEGLWVEASEDVWLWAVQVPSDADDDDLAKALEGFAFLRKLPQSTIPKYITCFGWDGGSAFDIHKKRPTELDTSLRLVVVQRRVKGYSLARMISEGEGIPPQHVKKILLGVLASLETLHLRLPPIRFGHVTTSSVLVLPSGAATLVGPGPVADALRRVSDASSIDPPERRTSGPILKSDLFSLAIAILTFVSRKSPDSLPFDTDTGCVDVSRVAPLLEPSVSRLLRSLTDPAPGRRPTAREARKTLEGRRFIRAVTRRLPSFFVGFVSALLIISLVVVIAGYELKDRYDIRDSQRLEPHNSSWSPSVSAEPARAYFSKVRLIDANGDEDLDVVGGSNGEVQALDGRTGKVLWTVHPYPEIRVFTDGRSMLVVLAGFKVAALSANSGAKRWETKLNDEADGIAFGDGCLAVGLKDTSVVTLSGETGEPHACPDAPKPQPWYSFTLPPKKHADVDFSVNAVGSGTPKLEVVAKRGKETLWTTPIPGTSSISSVVIDAGIVVLAEQRGASSPSYDLVLIDVSTGKVLQHRAAGVRHITPTLHVNATDRFVYADLGGAIYAIDVATWSQVWSSQR